MKKLMLLGGSPQQVTAIRRAKALGYQTVLCDYLPDNPGQYWADKFYQVSTTDIPAVLKIAEEERIDGIVAYASDPAAPTAAYVAEKLGLPGNPYSAVDALCNKDKFRRFLKENGFCTPESQGYGDTAAVIRDVEKFRLPVILKPVDSSGSKGVTVLREWKGLEQAAESAFVISRSKRIIVEEYIEKHHEYLIGGDIFVLDGRVVLWGLLNCHRDSAVNPLVPVGKSYPLELPSGDVLRVRQTLQDMVTCLGIRNGAMNVELVVDAAGNVWPIDVGPRNGGNMIPELLECIFGVNVVELTLKVAMGERVSIPETDGNPYFATHNLHSAQTGVFSDIRFSDALQPFLLRKSIYKKAGDPVEYFDNAAKALGIVFLKFPDRQTMQRILADINTHIQILLEP